VYLILGLGNPGPRYELTRHNLGFLVVDNLAEKHGIRLAHHKYHSQYGRGEIDGAPVIIAKPMTYMNESGRAAQALLSFFKISPNRMIVVHDDIDLVLGKMKRKFKGGHAGQRGVGSIKDTLGTEDFARIRLGIGRPEDRDEIVDYVLTPFSDEEIPLVNEVVELAIERIENTLIEIETKSKSTTEDNSE